MSASTPYPWRVMISSVMDGVKAERETIARLIKDAYLSPWYAERPPEEFAGESPETISFSMAARCDLYLLIIFSRYGSQVYPEDTRAVTHQEYHHAREANPRKVRVFIAADALDHADSPELRSFIDEVKAFKTGYDVVVFNTSAHLEQAVQDALERFVREGQGGRDAYVLSVKNEYRAFLNPATGQEMEYSDTVQLKLRAQLTPTRERQEWDDQDEEGDRTRPRTERARGRSNREQARGRLRPATQSSPQIATALITQHQRLIILGDVGAGKSTLLKRMTHDSAGAYQRGQESRLPILVTATRLGAMARQYPTESLAEVVGRVQEEETRIDALRPTIRSTVSSALANGQALLLVDGLDEASMTEQAAVVTLLGQIGTNWAALASRPYVYQGQPAGWQVADLQPLGATQRRELVQQVFRLEHQSDDSPPSEEALEEEATEIEQALQERRADLAAWRGNPLLLTLIAVQFVRDHHLPENRARIYEFAIEDLQRQRPPNARRYLTGSEVQRLLQTLSLRMQEALRRTATVAEVRDTYLRDKLAEFPNPVIRRAVVLEVLHRAGVLQADRAPDEQELAISPQDHQGDEDSYTFVHLSFREYLAACAFESLPPDDRQCLTRRHALHAEWDQVFLLLVSRLDASGHAPDADKLISALVTADDEAVPALGGTDPTHLALRLASQCALTRGKQTHDVVLDQLRAAWWRLWRAEERRYHGVSEVEAVVQAFSHVAAEVIMVESPLPMLAAGLPFLFAQLSAPTGFRRSRWWVYCLLVALSVLALLVVMNRVTSASPTLASSLWSEWQGGGLPTIALVTLVIIAVLRLYGTRARTDMVRRNILAHVLEARDRGLLGEAAVEPLVQLLRDTDRFLRRAAARALGSLEDARAVEPLLKALRDRNSEVREGAAEALGLLEDPAIESSLGAAAIELLLAQLRDEHYFVRRTAAQAVASLGPAAVEPLLERLRDPDWRVRQSAVRALGLLKDARAVEPLLEVLRDRNSEVGEAAVRALRRLEDAAIALLLDHVDDADGSIRNAAAQSLGRLGDARGVRRVVRYARRPLWEWTIRSLALIRGLTDWPVLLTVAVAQVALLAPQLVSLLPQPLVWLFGFASGWWILTLIAIVSYVATYIAWTEVIEAQGGWGYYLDAAEQLISRQVADTKGNLVPPHSD